MDAKLIAKITVPRTDGEKRIGTGFPIGRDLLLTARHVVLFDKRDVSKPIKVEWPDLPDSELTLQTIDLAYDGGNQFDVAVIRCTVPNGLKIPPVTDLMDNQKIVSRDSWESAGFPKIENFAKTGPTGIFGTDLEKMEIALTLDDTINPQIAKANGIENGWGGMSGAPIFSIGRKKLQAVVTNHNQWMQKQLIGVSLPWLLKNSDEFCKAVGFQQSSSRYDADKIKAHLSTIETSTLFTALADKFRPGFTKEAETVSQGIENAFNDDRFRLLEDYRLVVEASLKSAPQDLSDARKLFLLLLASFAEQGGSEVRAALHRLNVRTRMAAEIELAAYYGLAPDLIQESAGKEGLRGRYAIESDSLRETGWKPEAAAAEITKVVNKAVNKVYTAAHNQDPKSELDAFDREELNETLLTRRKGSNPQLWRFEVASTDELMQTHPLHNDNVCAVLQGQEGLADLPIAHFGFGTANQEAKLNALVKEFFRILEPYEKTV